jgi:hypothetical protein
LKHSVLFLALAAWPTAGAARDALGMFDNWGAFRDPTPLRCFAVATPVAPGKGRWKPFAAIGFWPDKGVRGQLHIRLSREKRANADVYLTVDDRRWRLLAGRYDAWAPSARHDSFIRAKMRAARSMSVSSVDADGQAFADTYRLQGAATAMDTAALGCVRR